MKPTRGAWSLLALVVASSPTWGQIGGLAGGGGGIHVDAAGVLRISNEKSGSKPKSPKLAAELARRSDLRRISLRQLDGKIRNELASTGELSQDVAFCAGLHKIEYVILDSETKDVQIVGPAEGWRFAANGTPVGSESKRPVIHVEDLAAALRCVLKGSGAVRCSIDPTREGLSSVRKLSPANISSRQQGEEFAKRVVGAYGLQSVRTGGVPPESKFAMTMIEADYRMKRLALGVERFAGLHSHLDTLASKANVGETTFNLARWWFTPHYESVAASEDGDVFRIRGQALKLLNEEVLFDESGNRRGTGRSSADWDRFSESFTKLLPKMEQSILSFAELHNLFDLMLVAGLIKHVGRESWLEGSALLDDSVYPLPRYRAPAKAEPVVNFDLSKNMQLRKHIFTFCYGGVSMDPLSVLRSGGFRTGVLPDGVRLKSAGAKNPQRAFGDGARPSGTAAGAGESKSASGGDAGGDTSWWVDLDRGVGRSN